MNKYRNTKVQYEGIKFDSIKERDYYIQLQLQMKAIQPEYKVLNIELQVPYPIFINNKKICTYIADFVVTYKDRAEVIDVKGFKTQIYKLKKKLVEAIYGITIKEI